MCVCVFLYLDQNFLSVLISHSLTLFMVASHQKKLSIFKFLDFYFKNQNSFFFRLLFLILFDIYNLLFKFEFFFEINTKKFRFLIFSKRNYIMYLRYFKKRSNSDNKTHRSTIYNLSNLGNPVNQGRI